MHALIVIKGLDDGVRIGNEVRSEVLLQCCTNHVQNSTFIAIAFSRGIKTEQNVRCRKNGQASKRYGMQQTFSEVENKTHVLANLLYSIRKEIAVDLRSCCLSAIVKSSQFHGAKFHGTSYIEWTISEIRLQWARQSK